MYLVPPIFYTSYHECTRHSLASAFAKCLSLPIRTRKRRRRQGVVFQVEVRLLASLFQCCPHMGLHPQMCTHSDFLPPPEIKKDVAPLLTLCVGSNWVWEVGVFGEPHLHGFVEAPISAVPDELRV